MGAPQSRLFETALALKKLGWEIVVITAMPNYPTGKIFEGFRNKLFTSEEIDGIKIWRYFLYASNAKKVLPRVVSMFSFSLMVLFSVFKVRKFSPAYIITESPPLTLGLSGLILCKACRAKQVLNVSDIWPLSAFELGAISKGFVYSQLERLEKFLYINSFACTGQSQEIVDQLELKGSKHSLLFRNGVDSSRFFNSKNSSSIAIPKGKVRIVYAGLLGVAQGILSLCQNIDFDILNCEFHIYGQGAEKNEIEKYLTDNQTKGIFLHNSIPRDQVPAMLMQYDVTIIPLIKPIFGAVPSKIYEAMAAGLPIIFSGGGEGARIIEEFELGWTCAPSDFNDIRNVIAGIGSLDTVQLKKMKENAIHIAQTVFDRNIQIGHLNTFLLNHLSK